MSTSSRLVAVSNQDARILYIGNWSLTSSSNFASSGNFGPPLEQTLHTTTSDSSFAFQFSGSYISVLGLITTGSSSNQPQLQCFVDGVSVSPDITTGENNVHLCTSTFNDGPHQLTVNISTQGTSFFLDNLQYQPSADVPLNNATVLIANIDPSITYSPGWTQSGGFTANMTEATNAFANVSFIGNQIGWFGIIPGDEPQAPSLAEYSVDDGPLISFTLQGLPSGTSSSDNFFNIPFFTTDVLEQGSHMLFVRYLGNGSTTPLTLNNLLVTNASASATMTPTSSFVPSTSSSNSPPSTSQSNGKRTSSAGAIAGGVVGGVLGIGLVAVLLFIYYRRSKRDREGLEVVPEPHTSITPFRLDPSTSQPPAMGELRGPDGATTTQRSKFRATTQAATSAPPPAPPASPPVLYTTGSSSSQQGPASTGTSASVSAPAHSSHPSVSLSTPTNPNSSINQELPIQLQHQDSGLRIITPGQPNIVVERPPTYTST